MGHFKGGKMTTNSEPFYTTIDDNDEIIDRAITTVQDSFNTQIWGASNGITPNDIWTTVNTSGIVTAGNGNYSFSSESCPSLKVSGDAEFEGDLKIQGKSITETLEKIEQRLNILRVNPELESRWKELKELGDKYRELERECSLKEKMIDILRS